MKITNILFLSLMCTHLFSQTLKEKEVKTEISEVTVFLEGAQVVRKKTIELPAGQIILKFTGLSPFIEPKSIQVKTEDDLSVLSVNHQQNYLNKTEKSAELSELEKKLTFTEEKIKLENTYLWIIKEELSFLQENRNIGGKNEQLNLSNLQQTSDFYSQKLTLLKMKELERNKAVLVLNEEKDNLQNQIKQLTGKKNYPTGEIRIKTDVKKTGNYTIELTYITGNAGWFPSYDIRAKDIDHPIRLIYKANVRQDTKEDWNNVKLRFSSAGPNVLGIAPTLTTYFLNYNTLPPIYKRYTNSIHGKVTDSEGMPIVGATVKVEGSTIGTITDTEGKYSIAIPQNAKQLTFSYLGYNAQTLTITGNILNVILEENRQELEDIVVVGYGVKKKGLLQKTPAISYINQQESPVNEADNLPSRTTQVENQTTVNFEIKIPYSIKSDNKNYTVDMKIYDLPAFYTYYSVPKIDKDAFLIAHITDWEKYNLLEGESNVFFENTYVGKTLMNLRNASDTLEISLGRDKKVSINREQVKNFSSKQFIGSKKEESRAWKTTVRNNKSQEINMVIVDQTPVSTNADIEVNTQNTTGAKHEIETGEIKWEFRLKPNEKKELNLKYTVKFPKNRSLIIE